MSKIATLLLAKNYILLLTKSLTEVQEKLTVLLSCRDQHSTDQRIKPIQLLTSSIGNQLMTPESMSTSTGRSSSEILSSYSSYPSVNQSTCTPPSNLTTLQSISSPILRTNILPPNDQTVLLNLNKENSVNNDHNNTNNKISNQSINSNHDICTSNLVFPLLQCTTKNISPHITEEEYSVMPIPTTTNTTITTAIIDSSPVVSSSPTTFPSSLFSSVNFSSPCLNDEKNCLNQILNPLNNNNEFGGISNLSRYYYYYQQQNQHNHHFITQPVVTNQMFSYNFMPTLQNYVNIL
ncbi:unnamed protein product [Trichobilharzia regenti]|nr:unnamed protein product [Trichobilharzia regenti]